VTESILIVEDEDDIARLIAMNLDADGFETHISSSGDDAFDRAVVLRPDLVILDLMLPGVDGVEVCRQLRKDPRTASVGIIMLTARTLPDDRVLGLEVGADDYIDKPFDVQELLARVHSSLRRSRQLRHTSPLTGLPGNFEIEARLDSKIAAGEDFALLHIDLDGFKAFNDGYGFVRGDRAISLTCRVIEQAVSEVCGVGAFIGHIGGDDFVVVCDVNHAGAVSDRIVGGFDAIVGELYDPKDREAGYIELADRTGELRRHPLMSISIGVATTAFRRFSGSAEVAAVAAELKAYAKSVPGSTWRVDRRTRS
jgi:DNA-binding response OmpR family regulator